MNLSVYLSELLKTNDCVIIPDLGGFIANYHSSGYNPQNDQFTPPSKEIIFSGKLKKNDGLFVNFVGEKEGVGYLEARKIVSEFVSECLFKLENGEAVEFNPIGSLRFDQQEHLLFEAHPQANLRTDAFGLDAVHFPPLVSKYTQPPKPVFRDKDPEPQKMRRPALKYLLIGLPILALLYFLPINKILNRGDSRSQSIPNTASLALADAPVKLNAEATSPSEVLPEAKTAEKNTSGEAKVEVRSTELVTIPDHVPVTPVAANPEKTIVQPLSNEPSKGKFHVVGGCFKVKENADKLADKLIKQGYHASVSSMGRSFFRVTVESYQTRREAEQAMINLLEAEPESEYWVMADKR